MTPPHRVSRRAGALLGSGVLLAVTGLAGLAPTTATASSHREAPDISHQPSYDNTDLYAFRSPDAAAEDTVTFVANWWPFSEPAGGPNFYQWADDARYEIHIDNDGDAKAEVTYRWDFDSDFVNGDTFLYNTGPVTSLTDPDLNYQQVYTLTEQRENMPRRTLLNRVPAAPSYVGEASMPDYGALRAEAVKSLPSGGKSFAGQADDSFFLDLRVFDLLYGGDFSEVGDDTLAGFNVNTIALQVPVNDVVDGDPVIGIWSTTSRQDSRGAYQQISRLGNPLVNEVVIPVKDKDAFNRDTPRDDAEYAEYVTDPILPPLIKAVYGDAVPPVPPTPRDDLVQVFLTGVPGLNQPEDVRPAELLRLNTSIAPSADPKRLGVLEGDTQGFPNGRRLTDDVVDIALQVSMGELVGQPNDLGDAVNMNDKEFTSSFPYVALPASGSDPDPHPVEGFTLANGGSAPNSPVSPIPLAPVALLSLGLLALAAGAVAVGRNKPAVATA